MRRIVERVAQTGSDYVNSVLGTEWARTADRWLRDVVDAKATVVSRAMDAEYLRTRIGGGWHRLFDGGHDLWGAFKATRSATPDDTLLQQLGTYATEVWKDLATPNGLPVFTWKKESFDAFSGALQQHLHVSAGWVTDMATFTATELGGAVAAIAAMLMNLRSSDPDRYAEMCGSLGVAAMVAANPLLVAVWLALVLKIAHDRNRLMRWRSSFAVLRGAAVTGTVILTIVALGPLGLIVALPLALVVRKLLLRLALGWSRQMGRGALAALRNEAAVLLSAPAVPLAIAGPKPSGA